MCAQLVILPFFAGFLAVFSCFGTESGSLGGTGFLTTANFYLMYCFASLSVYFSEGFFKYLSIPFLIFIRTLSMQPGTHSTIPQISSLLRYEKCKSWDAEIDLKLNQNFFIKHFPIFNFGNRFQSFYVIMDLNQILL